jgi:hypothetical protein
MKYFKLQKKIIMKLRLQDSIYQQKKAGPGLVIEDGMLINNRPNSVTGIQKAVEVKNAIKREEKISTMSQAFYRGEMMADLDKSIKFS